MLGKNILHVGSPRASWQLIQWSLALAQRDHMRLRNLRKKFAEAPDPALVERIAGSAAHEPERLQYCRVNNTRVSRPTRKKRPPADRGSKGRKVFASGVRGGQA